MISEKENFVASDELWERSNDMAAAITEDVCRCYLRYAWNKRADRDEIDTEMTDEFLEQAHQEFCAAFGLKNPTWKVQLAAAVYELLQEHPTADDPWAYFWFRLSGWRSQLDAALEGCRRLWQERYDYGEFLRLVRPHLAAGWRKSILQLMFYDGKWCFYDAEGNFLSLAELEGGQGWELADILGLDHDEGLIGILLNYAPEKLILHLGPGEMPPLGDLVSDLLGSRLICCSGCDFCRKKHQSPILL